MVSPRFFPVIAIFLILAAAAGWADEGMWPLYDLNKLPFDSLRTRGLQLQPEDIFNPGRGGLSDAVIRITGGTASFVSPEGLIITNHHVAAGAIQKQSTAARNYLRDGFYAATRADEIPAIGTDAYVTLAVEDVTDRIMADVDETMNDRERYQAIDDATKRIIKEAETGRDVKCSVAKMFGGKQFVLYTYFKIRDIRIVYAPPEAIGNFGGDIDNWMWPRHVGDFAFLRAYVAPDGSSVTYSEKNVPYRPDVYLRLSSQGVAEGDITIMMGYPGRTHRYASSFEVENLYYHYYPMSITTYDDRAALLEEMSATDPEVAVRLASHLSGVRNFQKKTYGLYEGFRRSDIVRKRQKQEQALRAFLHQNPALLAKYGPVLPELDSLYREKYAYQKKDHYLELFSRASDYLSMAEEIYRWASEREKDDLEREPGYQDRDSLSTRRWLQDKQINLVVSADRAMLKYLIKRAWDLPPGQKIQAIETIFAAVSPEDREQYLETYLDGLYANTVMGDLEQRMSLFHKTKDDLDRSDDAFIQLIIALMPEIKDEEERSKRRSGAESRLYPLLIQAYAEWKKDAMYPDANSSKRFNFGFVQGYAPYDAVSYRYLTSLSGVMEKESGEEPFIVPEPLKKVWAAKEFGAYVDPVIGDVPVNFLTSNSGTNGNSGSPVMNGKGELVGLDFDTNYQGVSADYLYNPDVARAIICDIRYVLFLLDNVYHLDDLLKELTIQ